MQGGRALLAEIFLTRPERMRVTIVGVILLLLLCPRASAQPTEGAEFEATKNLVVMIEGKLGEAPTQGAGIVFANQAGFVYIATAFHVVRSDENRATDLKVRFAQKPNEDFAAEHHPRAWYEHDLAVIRVKTPQALGFQLDRLADMAAMKKGDKVYAIGYPTTERWAVTFNPGFLRIVDAMTLKAESRSITEGYSGGALIDQRSFLAGMVLNTDSVMANALRLDRALDLIRQEVELPVQLSLRTPGALRTNLKDGLPYVWIPPGRFTMGCSKDDKECKEDQAPPHEVEITKGYWMGQTEVTQAAYRRVTDKDPSEFKGAKRPVERVSWGEANDYCMKAGLRLPTEAEWEYAARAGSTATRHGELDEVAWHLGNASRQTHEAGGKLPNGWNLYDTLGNAWEWVADWYSQDYYQAGEGKDPKGPGSGTERVMRGASWGNSPENVSVFVRSRHEPALRLHHIGFRCAGELR